MLLKTLARGWETHNFLSHANNEHQSGGFNFAPFRVHTTPCVKQLTPRPLDLNLARAGKYPMWLTMSAHIHENNLSLSRIFDSFDPIVVDQRGRSSSRVRLIDYHKRFFVE